MQTDTKFEPLGQEFYAIDSVAAARQLLGKIIVRNSESGTCAAIITETEAYAGPNDRAAHSFGGKKTPRTRIQFGPGGYLYTYRIYGMHVCCNIVVGEPEQPEVVLIRAAEPLVGIEQMRERRGGRGVHELCSGPGKLCAAMDISMDLYGASLRGPELMVCAGPDIPPELIMVSPRINVDYAGKWAEKRWRFFIRGSEWVSRVPRKYRMLERPWSGDLNDP